MSIFSKKPKGPKIELISEKSYSEKYIDDAEEQKKKAFAMRLDVSRLGVADEDDLKRRAEALITDQSCLMSYTREDRILRNYYLGKGPAPVVGVPDFAPVPPPDTIALIGVWSGSNYVLCDFAPNEMFDFNAIKKISLKLVFVPVDKSPCVIFKIAFDDGTINNCGTQDPLCTDRFIDITSMSLRLRLYELITNKNAEIFLREKQNVQSGTKKNIKLEIPFSQRVEFLREAEALCDMLKQSDASDFNLLDAHNAYIQSFDTCGLVIGPRARELFDRRLSFKPSVVSSREWMIFYFNY